MDNSAINSANFSLNAAKDNETNLDDLKQRLEELFRNWQNNLQNLNGLNEVMTFINESHTQNYEFDNEIGNRIMFFCNRNRVEVDEMAKEVHRNLESMNYNEAFHRNNQNVEEYRKRAEQNSNKIKKLNEMRDELREKWQQICYPALQILQNLNRQEQLQQQHHGLSSEIIEKFPLFTADQSHVGDQCSICMEDFEIGTNMMRLNCDGRHAFCQVCIEGWFSDHNTCPLCRHKFE